MHALSTLADCRHPVKRADRLPYNFQEDQPYQFLLGPAPRTTHRGNCYLMQDRPETTQLQYGPFDPNRYPGCSELCPLFKRLGGLQVGQDLHMHPEDPYVVSGDGLMTRSAETPLNRTKRMPASVTYAADGFRRSGFMKHFRDLRAGRV